MGEGDDVSVSMESSSFMEAIASFNACLSMIVIYSVFSASRLRDLSGMNFIRLLNSNLRKNSSNFAHSGSRISRSLAETSSGTSGWKVASSRLSLMLSMFSDTAFLIFTFFIFSRFSIMLSRFLNSFNSFTAVFSPIPGTPGMLSEASPMSAMTSGNCDGATPNLSITSFSSVILSFMVS